MLTSLLIGVGAFYTRRARLHTPKRVLIDPYIVEEKNVGRQLFTCGDASLGLAKAEVVGRRLNMALGLDIAWIAEAYRPARKNSVPVCFFSEGVAP